jgi:DNA-binding NarL/FixJ family response regulator
VVIAHDQRLLVRAIEGILEGEEDIDVVGTMHSPERVVPLIAELGPDLVLLRYGMAPPDRGPLLDRIRAAHPQVDVVLLGESLRPELAHEAMVGRGAKGIIDERADPAVFAPALRAAARGGAPIVGAAGVADQAHELGLTPREQSVLLALARGRSNAQIASDLAIATPTVKYHLGHIYDKLGVASRIEAVRAVIERAIYPVEWL